MKKACAYKQAVTVIELTKSNTLVTCINKIRTFF